MTRLHPKNMTMQELMNIDWSSQVGVTSRMNSRMGMKGSSMRTKKQPEIPIVKLDMITNLRKD